MLAHLVRGLCTIWFVFPSLDAHARRARVRSWSRRLLHLMGIDIRMTGTLVHPNVMVVANHISWLDIFVLNAAGPVRFIAKAEIARWPVLGRLVARRRHAVHRARAAARHASRQSATSRRRSQRATSSRSFPKARRRDGTTLLPFKGSLLQPIVDAGGHVQPVAIRYRTPTGDSSTAPAYVGDVTFVGSFWRVCGERALVVEIDRDAAAAGAAAKHRRELAHAAEDAIRTALASPARDSAPGTRADPAAGSP